MTWEVENGVPGKQRELKLEGEWSRVLRTLVTLYVTISRESLGVI